jgi:hypothetical protein
LGLILGATCIACTEDSDPPARDLPDPPDANPGTHTEGDAAVQSGVFRNLRVEDIGGNRAVVRFDTTIETTCEVEFGTDASELGFSATDPNMDPDDPYDVEHEVPLEDLLADTRYFFRARATDRNDEIYVSEVASFSTTELEGGVVLRENVALAALGTLGVEVSSTFGGGDDESSWGANHAIGGLMSADWARNGDGDDRYLVLDFGQERQLEAFAFRSRKMTDGTSIISQVALTIDGVEFGPYLTPNPDQVYKFGFQSPVRALRVRVDAVVTTGGNAGAKEIQFFAAGE